MRGQLRNFQMNGLATWKHVTNFKLMEEYCQTKELALGSPYF
jgi:hypothetical protein